MSKRATSTVTTLATATALAGALLLSGCGDGDKDGSSDKIEGAGAGKKTSSPSASAKKDKDTGKNEPDAPKFDFPKGVRADVAGDRTGDEEKDAVLRDHGYALRASVLSFATADADLPQAQRFFWGKAGEKLRYSAAQFKKDGKVGTGVYRYYNRKAEVRDSNSAVVTYCESQRDAFAKKTKTDKVLRTKPSMDDFTSFKDLMQKQNGEWKVMSTYTKNRDARCER